MIRFNDAPTDGHADDVGGRTTLRIQNVMTCGWHEFSDEICLHYTSWPGTIPPSAVSAMGALWRIGRAVDGVGAVRHAPRQEMPNF